MYNLTMQTDAYHMTMGYLLENPMEIENHVLYARQGGPQVVADLSRFLHRLLQSVPTHAQITTAALFWREQGIPFPSSAWHDIARNDRLPLTVRGVPDGEVVLPGDPIAVFSGPAVLVGAIEPLLLGDQMASMQLATRFTRLAAALDWQTDRLFEVGLRAVDGPQTHRDLLSRLKRLGLRYTSHGQAAVELGLRATGTMGHRFTQRFVGHAADERAFEHALLRMLQFHDREQVSGKLPLSFLLDTRSTLQWGLPAAIAVIKKYASEIEEKIALSVRLDSGDLTAQLKKIMQTFQLELPPRLHPSVIMESGLTAENIAGFERVAKDNGFDRDKMLYGVGGYLVGGLNRDAISLVYKITSFGGSKTSNYRDQVATMKFGDEPFGAKESYPGRFELWEHMQNGQRIRTIAQLEERNAMTAAGATPLYRDLVIDGEAQSVSLRSDEQVRQSVKLRWQTVTGAAIDAHWSGAAKPRFSKRMQQLVDRCRDSLRLPETTPTV